MKVFTQVILPADHPFIYNKYTIWYYGIIHCARLRSNQDGSYVELHHIIPDSLYKKRSRKGSPGFVEGDPNHSSNLVLLTAREHILCHWLLTKMLLNPWVIKMEQAFNKMAHQSFDRGYVIPALLYERMRIARSIHSKNTKWFTDGVINTRSIVCPEGFRPGMTHSEDGLQSLKVNGSKGASLCTRGPWYTNGVQNIRSNNPPTDYYLGYTYSDQETEKRRQGGFKAIDTRRQRGTDKLSAKTCLNISAGRKGQIWWTDGHINKLGKVCPEPGFIPGFTKSQEYLNKKQAKRWWTNGIDNILSESCPDGYHSGKTSKIKKSWWTNGTINVFDAVCPSGFKSGRKFKS